MIHLLICGHGRIPEGLHSGLKLLAGDVPCCEYVNFSEGMSSEALAQALAAAEARCQGAPLLILADIMGGTPFRQAALLAGQRADCELISGVNLPLLIEAVMERDDAQDIAAFAQHLIDSGRDSIARYSALLQNQIKNKPVILDGDGI